MVFHTYKIEHIGKNEDESYSGTAVELSDVVSINLSFGIGETADGFSFSVTNNDNNKLEGIKIDDRVKIYGSLDGVTYPLLMDGIVQNKTSSDSVSSKVVTYSGLNRLEKLFNALVSTTASSAPKPASFWIDNIITQVNNFNNQGNVDRTIEREITTTTKNVTFTRGFEKAFKLIEELSKPEMTGNGQYIYYMKNDNTFVWKPMGETSQSELEFGDNQILSHRTRKGMYDIVNYIIHNAGKSPYGATILQVDYDEDSIRKYGWKTKLVTQNIAAERLNRDRASKAAEGWWTDDSDFPDFTKGTYVSWWGDDSSTESEYNNEFVAAVQAESLELISGWLVRHGVAQFKIDISVDPSFGFVLGNLHTLKIPSNEWIIGEEIRINNINMNFSTEGWTTDLKLKDDDRITEGTT